MCNYCPTCLWSVQFYYLFSNIHLSDFLLFQPTNPLWLPSSFLLILYYDSPIILYYDSPLPCHKSPMISHFFPSNPLLWLSSPFPLIFYNSPLPFLFPLNLYDSHLLSLQFSMTPLSVPTNTLWLPSIFHPIVYDIPLPSHQPSITPLTTIPVPFLTNPLRLLYLPLNQFYFIRSQPLIQNIIVAFPAKMQC